MSKQEWIGSAGFFELFEKELVRRSQLEAEMRAAAVKRFEQEHELLEQERAKCKQLEGTLQTMIPIASTIVIASLMHLAT